MNRDEIVEELFRMQDKDYAALQAKIIPSAAADRIIGVRTPALRAFAKRLSKDNDVTESLPEDIKGTAQEIDETNIIFTTPEKGSTQHADLQRNRAAQKSAAAQTG